MLGADALASLFGERVAVKTDLGPNPSSRPESRIIYNQGNFGETCSLQGQQASGQKCMLAGSFKKADDLHAVLALWADSSSLQVSSACFSLSFAPTGFIHESLSYVFEEVLWNGFAPVDGSSYIGFFTKAKQAPLRAKMQEALATCDRRTPSFVLLPSDPFLTMKEEPDDYQEDEGQEPSKKRRRHEVAQSLRATNKPGLFADVSSKNSRVQQGISLHKPKSCYLTTIQVGPSCRVYMLGPPEYLKLLGYPNEKVHLFLMSESARMNVICNSVPFGVGFLLLHLLAKI